MNNNIFLSVSPFLLVVISVFMLDLSPLSQSLFFLVLFISVCFSLHSIWEYVSDRKPKLVKKIDDLKTIYGLLIGFVSLCFFLGLFLFVFNTFNATGLLNNLITLVLMYLGLGTFIFILSCFLEGITQQKKTTVFKPVMLFVSIGYVIMTTFGILQLLSMS
ncbi:hypothetical protein [Exiguobacterium sp. SH0S2]|uniref:hypothetical protein n=1 Tax=Exiguobacterium sp. SH0S2 TaxID=2510950 RepID=UPI00103FB79C|nr:hypothetical protein [Exiguobacterium sp. SH0S2]TCI59074.1 hypothetical protein EVJ21_14145 [Exiguobacterium sp. SH0S2]